MASDPKGLGPAVAIAWKGRIHWGWFLKFRGRRLKAVLACGRSIGCSGPSIFSTSQVNCPRCLAKANSDPDLIAGNS